MIYIVVPEQCLAFRSMALNYEHLYTSNGYEAQIVWDLSNKPPTSAWNERKVSEDDVCLVFWWGSIRYLPPVLKRIIINMDPMVEWILKMFKYFHQQIMKPSDIFIDYAYSENREVLAPFNLNYQVVPYGFSPSHIYFYDKYREYGKEDIDVLFYCNLSPRRVNIINQIQAMCDRKGYEFVVCNNTLYSEESKAALVSKAKIVLSIASADALTFKTNDLARLSYLLSNGKLVIADRVGDSQVEDKLSEYVVFTNDFPTTIEEYLSNPDKLKEKGDIAVKFKNDFNLEPYALDYVRPRVNYVIATYEGQHASRVPDMKTSPIVLETQLQVLYNHLENDPTHYINYLTIVCPKCKPQHQPFKGYYGDQKEWIRKFKDVGVQLVYLDYKGSNNHHSYDQWIQGMMLRKDADYHLVIEDDYLMEAPGFEVELIYHYTAKFSDGVGYLCSLIGPHKNYQYPTHAAISNGLISQKTMERLGWSKVLNKFYALKEINAQLSFSSLFSQEKIPILDYTDSFRVEFWDTTRQAILDYTKEKTKGELTGHLFMPVQSYFKRLKEETEIKE